MIFIRQHAHDPREKEDDERETAEQELRYRELLKANEELQRKVAEVSFESYIFVGNFGYEVIRLRLKS